MKNLAYEAAIPELARKPGARPGIHESNFRSDYCWICKMCAILMRCRNLFVRERPILRWCR